MPITVQHHQQGFTAVIVAALFVAFAVVGAVLIERNTTTQHIYQRDTTIAQLNNLSNAIIEYSVLNRDGATNLYPCPARLDLATTDANFGDAAPNCWNSAVALPASMDVPGAPANTSVIRGMVPVLKLSAYGIGVNDAFDPWNNRIVYVVNRRLTLGSSSFTAAQSDNPTLVEARTGLAIASPDFILISYGRDGKGGYSKTGTSITIPCAAASTLLREENCDNDINFVTMPTNVATNATGATYFDDILTYYRQ